MITLELNQMENIEGGSCPQKIFHCMERTYSSGFWGGVLAIASIVDPGIGLTVASACLVTDCIMK